MSEKCTVSGCARPSIAKGLCSAHYFRKRRYKTKLTIIESPFAGEIERNKLYLRRAVRDSIERYEIPFASHGFYPQFLDDSFPEERDLGIRLGYFFWRSAERVVFYIDYGMSPGMEDAASRLEKFFPEMKTSVRRIGQND